VRALAYGAADASGGAALDLAEVADPTVREHDLLVDVRAIGVNPGEVAMGRTRSAPPGGRLILGWEFSGVVAAVGPAVEGFAVGDRVMGTGDVARDGCWAERVAVDHRVVASLPDELSFVDAASLPIGALTAWEALFRDGDALPRDVERVLVVGGAGGVGSLATQLLKARTSAAVIATASRPASREWCARMGADLVVDHAGDVPAALRVAGVDRVDLVLATAATVESVGWIAEVLRPFGHLATIDLAGPVDLGPLVERSVSLHTEMVFGRGVHDGDLAAQGRVLRTVLDLVRTGALQPIATTRLDGLTRRSMADAHDLVGGRRTVGKVVLAT
jgi:zinc-binding alcohol dehydrogenase family protein